MSTPDAPQDNFHQAQGQAIGHEQAAKADSEDTQAGNQPDNTQEKPPTN